MGKQWKQWETLFSCAPNSLQVVTEAMKFKDACSLEEKDQPRQHIKKQRHYFGNKDPSSQSYGFSSSNVWMWELEIECESWNRMWELETMEIETLFLGAPKSLQIVTTAMKLKDVCSLEEKLWPT